MEWVVSYFRSPSRRIGLAISYGFLCTFLDGRTETSLSPHGRAIRGLFPCWREDLLIGFWAMSLGGGYVFSTAFEGAK